MKLFTILVAAFAAFISAVVVPAPDLHPVEERGAVNIGGDFTTGLVEMITHFPGTKEIKKLFICMRKDKNWMVDYGRRGEGIVTFSNVPTKCCNMAQAGWNKYQKDWGKLATPVFNDPCSGGSLNKMKPSHIDKLRRMIGDGHGGK